MEVSDATTPLHEACEERDFGLVKRLIEDGANITAKDKNGRTPLHIACLDEETAIADLLIERGADTCAKDDHGFTPLDYAIADGYYGRSRVMEDACFLGYIALAKKLIEHDGVHINAKNKYGQTPLHLACDNFELVSALIARGADIKAKDNCDQTPLHLARHPEIAEVLIDSGADINAKDIDGKTLLHTAFWEGNMELVQILISRGADINVKDNDGNTPLDVGKVWQTSTLLR